MAFNLELESNEVTLVLNALTCETDRVRQSDRPGGHVLAEEYKATFEKIARQCAEQGAGT